MTESDFLYVCIEAGVALAGFSALALAIRARANDAYTEYERLVVAGIIERGLVAAFFALLPVLLYSFHMQEATIWTVSSGGLGVYGISVLFRSILRRRRLPDQALISNISFATLVITGTVIIILLLANALNVIVARGPSWHLLGITYVLLSAGYLFWFFCALGFVSPNWPLLADLRRSHCRKTCRLNGSCR